MSQRHALGLLFLAIALGFAGISVAGGRAGVWVVAAAAAALCAWMSTMSVRLLSKKSR